MEAIQQENLVRLELDRLAGQAPAFFEAVDRFFDGLAGKQIFEVLV